MTLCDEEYNARYEEIKEREEEENEHTRNV
jgi:hypothetical protein